MTSLGLARRSQGLEYSRRLAELEACELEYVWSPEEAPAVAYADREHIDLAGVMAGSESMIDRLEQLALDRAAAAI